MNLESTICYRCGLLLGDVYNEVSKTFISNLSHMIEFEKCIYVCSQCKNEMLEDDFEYSKMAVKVFEETLESIQLI